MSRLKILGRYLDICLELCTSIEHKNTTRSYELELKRKIYADYENDCCYFSAQMQEHIFNQMSAGPKSWVQHFLYLKKGSSDIESASLLLFGHNAQE